MRIIGLDLSLSCTGLAKPDGTTRSVRTSEPPARHVARLFDLAVRTTAYFPLQRADVAVLEDHGGGPGGRHTTLALAELHGAIKVQLHANTIDVVLVNPMTLKTWAGQVIGRTIKSKDDMVSAALTLGYQPGNDNEADAALLHAVGMQRYHPSIDRPDLTVKLAGLAWPEAMEGAHA